MKINRNRCWDLYVDANSANGTPPYATWATAAATIQWAVDAAKSGDTVLVTNGVYGVAGVTITNAIAVVSFN